MLRPWELRLDRAIRALQWGTLAVGVFLSFLKQGSEPPVLAATLLAGGYVVGSQVVPRRFFSRRWVGEVVSVSGMVLVALAMVLTGGILSPYLLLSLIPPLMAAALWGLRVGLEVATLAAGAALAFTFTGATVPDLASVVPWLSLYFLVSASVGYARRLLAEEDARVRRLEEESGRVARLEAAHSLLTRLAELTESTELNPIEVGNLALENIASLVPFQAGTVALSNSDGPLVVARRTPNEAGPGEGPPEHLFLPLEAGDREVGLVVLARSHPFDAREEQLVKEALVPVALAFGNLLLLQDIARRAVREERSRLARELHDEIGPSLASLGLAIDLTLLQGVLEPDALRQLEHLRGSVSDVVEEVRTVVADLRQPDHPSMLEYVRRLAAQVPRDGPKVIVTLQERRPPRPVLASELGAIIGEAFRNAVRHSEAATVLVDGQVDRDSGVIRIKDDGKGFDPGLSRPGRFGLVGMRERAEMIGASLRLDSTPGSGTLVEVRWEG